MEKQLLIENVSGGIGVTIFKDEITQADIELVKTHKIKNVDFFLVNAFEKIEHKEVTE